MSTEPVFFPAGVADPDGRAGYVGDGTGIVAVGLRRGKRLWRSERAQRPLISDGARLAAASLGGGAANTLEIVVLDAGEDGAPELVSDPVVLPDWAAAAGSGDNGFRMHARVEGDTLRLDWEVRAGYRGGAAPPRHVERAAAQDAAGAVRVDLKSGAVSPVPAERSDPRAARQPPLDVDEVAEPWVAGSVVARIDWDLEGGDQAVMLELSGTPGGKPDKTVELARGQALVTQVTRDGLHVLVHSEAGAPGDDAEWLVFPARTGERIATLPHDPGAHSPAILEGHAFYLVDRDENGATARSLRARELASGSLVWELPLAARSRSPAPRPRE